VLRGRDSRSRPSDAAEILGCRPSRSCDHAATDAISRLGTRSALKLAAVPVEEGLGGAQEAMAADLAVTIKKP